jgi:hypothetical protein
MTLRHKASVKALITKFEELDKSAKVKINRPYFMKIIEIFTLILKLNFEIFRLDPNRKKDRPRFCCESLWPVTLSNDYIYHSSVTGLLNFHSSCGSVN